MYQIETPKSFKVLLVDNDENILNTVSESLREEGHSVFTSNDSFEALAMAIKEKPQLILMELTMPGMDGIDLCLEFHKQWLLKDTMLVFHTNNNQDYEQIAAFNAGADDYIIKPIKLRVLNKRINALLSRTKQMKDISANKQVNGLRINQENYMAYVDDNQVELSKKEFEILGLLFTSPGKIFSRKEICEKVWGEEDISQSRTLDVHLRNLRIKIGDNYIKTIRKVGIYLDANITNEKKEVPNE